MTNRHITDEIWKNSEKYTHSSTGMEYIKFRGSFYFRVEHSTWRNETIISFKPSGALGGFELK